MSRKKRVILAHGWNDAPTNGWLGWLATQLQSRGIEVVAPAFPRPQMPRTKEWVETLRGAAGALTKDTVLVGYSLGAPTVLRFLNDYPDEVRVRGVVLVAGFGDDPSGILNGLFKPALDFEKLIDRAQVRVCIYSDNDYLVAPRRSQKLAISLAAREIIELGGGHFVARRGFPGATAELSVVLEAVLGCFVQPSPWARGVSGIRRILRRAKGRIFRDKEYT